MCQSGQYDLPVHRGDEQLWWIVGHGTVPLGGICPSDDERTAGASEPGGVQAALPRLLQPRRFPAEGV